MNADPFGTEALRTATLGAWRSSPTRFREDANAEEDLVLGGYRDRWFVELAQNAADAAGRAGVPGVLRVSIVDGELRVANNGEPLHPGGVAALASLRASGKRGNGTAGRFGVGFAAVLPVSLEPRVVSTSGGVRFSAARTREEVSAEPALRDELAHRRGAVPVLRLVWPTPVDEPGPPAGFATEVRLPLPPGAASTELLAQATEQAADVLLAFPALHCVELPAASWRRDDLGGGFVLLRDGQAGTVTRWRLVRQHGELPAELLLAAEEQHRPEWSVCWAVAVDDAGAPRPAREDVLHAPTPTDERLSLPARLLATLPVEPSRRRVRPGGAAGFVLGEAARSYPELVVAMPPRHRSALVPAGGFPLSGVDATLRDGVVAALRTARWLPAAAGGELAPALACVLDVPSAELARLLADLVPGLLAAELSEPAHTAALATLGVRRLDLAGVVEAVSGVDRPPGWWRELYAALAPAADASSTARDELAALPVPLADGRTVTGPRTTLVLDSAVHGIAGLRVVHPEAVHPLLVRLGAQQAGARALLESPELRDAVERSMDDAESGMDTMPLAGAVLRLVREAGSAPPWLGALALPAAGGEFRRADELVLPDGALRGVLAADGPVGVLRSDIVDLVADRDALRAIGVLDGFAVVDEEYPAGPDHDLADEERWWASLAEPPQRLLAVRDLDLVDDRQWRSALRLLDAEPVTARALHARPSYTGWWLARFASLGGRRPRYWRLPSAVRLAGLYDEAPVDLDERLLAAAGVRSALDVQDAVDAADLLARLADPARDVPAALAAQAHAALVAAALARRFRLDDVAPPTSVRAVTGQVVPAAGEPGRPVLVLDRPWLAAIVEPHCLVAGGDPATLAQLLDLAVASDDLSATVVSAGREVEWSRLPEVAAACEALGRPVPGGRFVRYDELRVRTPQGSEHSVPYWVDEHGTVHAADALRALVWLPPAARSG